MTDNEIIKALECCSNDKGIASCVDCPLANYSFNECGRMLPKYALDLINRQQAEIDRYKGVIKILERDVADARNEGAKDFGKYLIDKCVKGMITAGDIVDYCYEFTHEVTKIEQVEAGD